MSASAPNNLELLQQLQPSLVLLSQGYGPTPRKIQPIAPTMSFGFNDGSGKPLTVARQSLMALGQRLGIEGRAVNHLAQFDRFMQDARQRLQSPATVAAVFTDRYAPCVDHRPEKPVSGGDGSVGIRNAWQEQTDFWGTAVVGIERLAAVRNARVIYLDHGNQAMMDKVSATPLWQSLPFVRQNQLRQLPAVWFYGATLSTMRFCRLLAQAQESAA